MTLFWSINYVAAKIALRSFPALLFSPLRTIIAATCLIPIYFWTERNLPHHATLWTREEIPLLASLGVFGIALNQLLFVLGVQRTTVAHASLVVATTPIQVLLLARLRGQEHLSHRKLIGMATALFGVAALNFGPSGNSRGATILGDLLVLGASFTFALYTVAGKETSDRHGSVTVNTLGFVAGTVALTPLGWWQASGFVWSKVPVQAWLCLVYMAVCGSVISYLIYNYALAHAPASRVASFSYSQPFIATLIGFAVLREPITASVAIGGSLVLLGVYLAGTG
jgi:drug/metabolite transporter (DMT)-like permease